MVKTLEQLIQRAESVIARKEEIAFAIAAETGSILGNVSHLRWFKCAVADELINRYNSWSHLQPYLNRYRDTGRIEKNNPQ